MFPSSTTRSLLHFFEPLDDHSIIQQKCNYEDVYSKLHLATYCIVVEHRRRKQPKINITLTVLTNIKSQLDIY